jgi:hypothetical protein
MGIVLCSHFVLVVHFERRIFRANTDFPNYFNPFNLRVSCSKIFHFHFSEIRAYLPASRPQEGRYAIVTGVGAGCDGRVGVARRAARMRTAKVRGPDLPMLRSSLQR